MSLSRADKILEFYTGQKIIARLPKGVEVLNPFTEDEVIRVNREFYQKYYSDDQARTLILGINPGRFGAGITGIPFTDPIKLKESCGIEHNFPMKPELSSGYVYRLIEAFGGLDAFYSRFLIGAVSPLGFVKDGKNLNYYDEKLLQDSLKEYILKSMEEQIELAGSDHYAICLGEGKNYKYLQKLNESHKFFKEIIPFSHPRFIMQYRRKSIEEYINRQLEVLLKIN